jgi:hypothetical protein
MKLSLKERSRLKITLIGSIGLAAIAAFPSYVIIRSLDLGHYEAYSAWTAWGICIAAIPTLLGYYIQKETVRPSLGGNFFQNRIPKGFKKLVDEEDDTDPEQIPL